ncbi:hypothetical protein Tco_1457848 [Tanacetum coccineum]
MLQAIHMLTEKKYPLSQEMISKMLKKKLKVDHESSQAIELLRIDQGVGSTSGIRACALRNFDLGKMELENSQNNALAKLPMLKLGEYEMWEIRIKQYFQIQDYALWESIVEKTELKRDTRSRRSNQGRMRFDELCTRATPICEGLCRLTSLERKKVWNDCRNYKVRVGSNGNLLWEASVLLGRKKGSEFDFEPKCHLGKANVDVVPWSEAKNEFEIDV